MNKIREIEDILYQLVTKDHQRMDIMPLVYEYADKIADLYKPPEGVLLSNGERKSWEDALPFDKWMQKGFNLGAAKAKLYYEAQQAFDNQKWIELLSLVGISIDEYCGNYGIKVGGDAIRCPDRDDQEYFNGLVKSRMEKK